MLGFEAKTATIVVGVPISTSDRSIEEIARIELQTRLSRNDFEKSSGD